MGPSALSGCRGGIYSTASSDIEELGSYKDGKNEVVVKAAASANCLLKLLDGTDKRFNFNICNDVTNDAEILFLDLRLFSGKPSEEVKFIQSLCDLAVKFVDNNDSQELHWRGVQKIKNLPWPGFSSSEIESVRNWCVSEKRNKDGEDSEYIEALTFLPRILALTDLSLPIVLFSSTGRRDIAETLKEYGNIITDFDKPKFTVDMPDDIAKQTKDKFQMAIVKALNLLHGRQMCIKVNNLISKAATSPSMISASPQSQNYSHIEIYLDESGEVGETSFAVGGVIFAYPNYDTVRQLSNALESNGYYWYSRDETNTGHLSKEPGKPNEQHCGAQADIHWRYCEAHDALACLSKKHGVFFGAIRLSEDQQIYVNLNSRHFPCKDVSGEATYVRVFSSLLEIALFELIPQWIKQNVSVSVFAGTRTINLNLQGKLQSAETPSDYYGFGRHPFLNKYYTISDNSIAPIVSDILNKRELPTSLTVHHARAVYLTYGVPVTNPTSNKTSNKATWQGIRVQHYYADHVAKGMAYTTAYEKMNCYQPEFSCGFDETLDADLTALLDAQNEMMDHKFPFAIKLASTCNNVSGKIRRHIIEKFLKPLRKMSGATFIDLCLLNETDGVGTTVRTLLVVKYIQTTNRNQIRLICSCSDGASVTITENQTRKLGAYAARIKSGCRIWGVVFMDNGKAYARDILI
jgi:hypothetical protein